MSNIDMEKLEEYLISFEFILCYQNGTLIDNNVKKEPMIFRTGANEMLPALEAELIELKVGEKKRVFLSAKKAYGPILEEKFREFPCEAIPEVARQIGRKVMAVSPDGNEEMVDVVDIRGDKIVLNFNHPLAGKDLRFDVTVITKTPVVCELLILK
jgi:FKBP-type peptidyl-prolyl cis-trans isomerase SlyD